MVPGIQIIINECPSERNTLQAMIKNRSNSHMFASDHIIQRRVLMSKSYVMKPRILPKSYLFTITNIHRADKKTISLTFRRPHQNWEFSMLFSIWERVLDFRYLFLSNCCQMPSSLCNLKIYLPRGLQFILSRSKIPKPLVSRNANCFPLH